VKGIEAVEAKANSFKARMTVSVPMHLIRTMAHVCKILLTRTMDWLLLFIVV
jgi:hypothetical protein